MKTIEHALCVQFLILFCHIGKVVSVNALGTSAFTKRTVQSVICTDFFYGAFLLEGFGSVVTSEDLVL